MIHGFDTENRAYAVGALCVYATYRSRNVQRFKTSKDMWERIERFVKASAKRAKTLPEFIERLKPRLRCGSLRAQFCTTVPGEEGQREFLAKTLERADSEEALDKLLNQTCMIIALVRDRLEREKQEKNEKEGAN
jgi:uncharacterized membrane protein YgaE (UPF0421/DUF939 family)